MSTTTYWNNSDNTWIIVNLTVFCNQSRWWRRIHKNNVSCHNILWYLINLTKGIISILRKYLTRLLLKTLSLLSAEVVVIFIVSGNISGFFLSHCWIPCYLLIFISLFTYSGNLLQFWCYSISYLNILLLCH